MAESRPRLRELARRLGIEEGYRSALDGSWVATGDAAREALVRAMGFDCGSERAAEDSLARLGEASVERPEPGVGESDVRVDNDRSFGIFANLYSVRSAHNLGFGNLSDLHELVDFAARAGAAFVGVNPLHATVDRSGRFSPYHPASRCFRDPLYLDPARIPEWPVCPEARRLLASETWRSSAAALRAADALDVAASEALLFAALRPLYAIFRAREGDAADARRRAFATYRATQGAALTDFATFQALADTFEADTGGRNAFDWPAEYRLPHAPAVQRFREQHSDALEWHAWLQFEIDRQLAEVAGAARDAGLPIGLYTDLALGSSAGGSDVWAWPHLFAPNISVGAPPDAFAPQGQDWSFPPLDPHALRRDGFAFWRRLFDANLRHAGALRIDHALGLRRMFWIPKGAAASEGAYVRYPAAELLAVLTETARAHGALLIAEDLGTVPEGFSEELQANGMLSSRVLLFERDAAGFRPSASYPRQCLATANTHDLPPLAALDTNADLALRRRAGQIPDDATLAQRRVEREAERSQLEERLTLEGMLPRSAANGPDSDGFASAVTAFLCATPARLVGIALDDLAGEQEPINLPGVGPDRHASWTRRMHAPLAAIFASPRARRMLDAVPPERRVAARDDAALN